MSEWPLPTFGVWPPEIQIFGPDLPDCGPRKAEAIAWFTANGYDPATMTHFLQTQPDGSERVVAYRALTREYARQSQEEIEARCQRVEMFLESDEGKFLRRWRVIDMAKLKKVLNDLRTEAVCELEESA